MDENTSTFRPHRLSQRLHDERDKLGTTRYILMMQRGWYFVFSSRCGIRIARCERGWRVNIANDLRVEDIEV